jgi:Methyltransferase domain
VAQALDLAAGQTLVDLACGRGGPGLWFAQQADTELVGVDFSSVGVSQARHRAALFGLADRARFVVGDLARTGLAKASADAVVCIYAFHFATPREAVTMALPLETGPPGETRERAEDREAGASSGFLAPAVGAHREHGRATSRAGGARPKQGPSISYMEGPCGILPDRAASPAPTRRRWGHLSPTRDLHYAFMIAAYRDQGGARLGLPGLSYRARRRHARVRRAGSGRKHHEPFGQIECGAGGRTSPCGGSGRPGQLRLSIWCTPDIRQAHGLRDERRRPSLAISGLMPNSSRGRGIRPVSKTGVII